MGDSLAVAERTQEMGPGPKPSKSASDTESHRFIANLLEQKDKSERRPMGPSKKSYAPGGCKFKGSKGIRDTLAAS